MLTRELAIAEFESGRIIPDRLTRNRHAGYVVFADELIDIYRNGIGQTRQDLKRSVHRVFSDELACPVRRIDAFCKLLDEKSTYDRNRRGNAAKLRKQVFRMATESHPLVQQPDRMFESSEAEIKHRIASHVGKSWTQIERELFADVIEFHRLTEFEGYENGAALLSRYNVAQCQAVLYDAVSLTVWAHRDFKSIVRYAKLARLMHTIEQQSNGEYIFRFDGPVSILRQSRRYGVALAKFLPSLLACRGWKMQAIIQHRRSQWQNRFRLSSADGLGANLPHHENFDSKLEEDFAARWGDDSRDGWTMTREGEVLHSSQKVFIPDFAFQHESGVRVLMEVVGFWTPEYLAAKMNTLSRFPDHKILLAVSDSLDWPEDSSPHGVSTETFKFKTTIRVNDVIGRLRNRLAS